MYRIAVVALLPELVDSVFLNGVVGRGLENGFLGIDYLSPRDFTTDQYRSADDRPYGGGPGMVLKYEPTRDAIRAARLTLPAGSPALMLSAHGRLFDQRMANELAAGPGMLLVAGRYEGVDERVIENELSEEISLGNYVISGGELAAAVVIDAVARLLPGVLGDPASFEQDSFMDRLLDYPQYTRPEIIDGMRVPEVLMKGDHEAIRRWRLKHALGRTWLHRPALLETAHLTEEEQMLLDEFKAEYKPL
tara:strand:+ start:1166 stop:1912 length:747 start_codon:yes stop_codon:yes gene_type:complete